MADPCDAGGTIVPETLVFPLLESAAAMLGADKGGVVPRHRLLVGAIFLLSGAAGLTYEVVWSRQLVLVFGNTTQAVAAILTGYFLGMAVGNVLGGKLADRVHSAVRLYGLLELVLVAIVLMTPTLFGGIREVYRTAYAGLETTPGLLIAVRFVLAIVAVAPATVLMGATLPALSRHLARRSDDLGSVFSRLYAANTIGAVAGAAVAGFVSIELLGLSGTLVAGTLLSGTAGIIALAIAQIDRDPRAVTHPESAATPVAPPSSSTGGAVSLRRVALVVSFVSGATSLGYQSLWTRLLASGSGSSSYVFSGILVFFLGGLALGALIVGLVSRRAFDAVAWLGRIQFLIAAFAALGTIAIGREQLPGSPGLLLWPLVVLPTATAIGLSLPLAARLAATDDAHVGADSGVLLGVNTAGVVVGTVVVPFVAMPVLGSPMSVLVLAAGNVALGAFLLLGDRSRLPRAARTARVALGGSTLGLVVAIGVSGLAVDPSIAAIRARGQLYASREDEIASVQAGQTGGVPQLWVAGTSMTSLTVDARLMPVLPAIARPDARRLLVIAFGMGSSYRTGLVLGDQVDGVELVPSVPGMFVYFYPDARAVLADPNGRLLIADGRNYVELTDNTYDIIVADPPPPLESAGTGVLYAQEFYAAAARRLNPGGIMMEWIPYGQTLDEFRTHVRTFRSVFAEVTLVLGPGGNGVFMLGSATPIHLDQEAVRTLLAERTTVVPDISSAADSPVHTADAWAEVIPTLVLGTGSGVDRFAGPGPVITDDRPLTEYYMLRRLQNPGAVPMSKANLLAAFGLAHGS